MFYMGMCPFYRCFPLHASLPNVRKFIAQGGSGYARADIAALLRKKVINEPFCPLQRVFCRLQDAPRHNIADRIGFAEL